MGGFRTLLLIWGCFIPTPNPLVGVFCGKYIHTYWVSQINNVSTIVDSETTSTREIKLMVELHTIFCVTKINLPKRFASAFFNMATNFIF